MLSQFQFKHSIFVCGDDFIFIFFSDKKRDFANVITSMQKLQVHIRTSRNEKEGGGEGETILLCAATAAARECRDCFVAMLTPVRHECPVAFTYFESARTTDRSLIFYHI